MESLATWSVLSAADWLGELQEGQCLQVGETLRALTLESGPRIEFGDGGECVNSWLALYVVSRSVRYTNRRLLIVES